MKNKEVIELVQKHEVKTWCALNKKGELVLIEDANKDETYFCKFCRLPMYVKTRQETKFYAKFPRTEHRNSFCQEFERTGILYTFVASEKPEDLIGRILHVPMAGGGRRTGGGGLHGGPTTKVKPFRSMLQIFKYAKAVNNPREKIGDHEVKDIILWGLFVRKFIPKLIELGARIVHVKYDFFDRASSSLVFHNYCRNKDMKEIEYQVKFHMVIRDEKELVKYHKEVQPRYMDKITGRMIFGKKREALLGSPEWKRVSESECKVICERGKMANCQKCCGMYCAEYYSKKQIVVLPEEK